MPSPQRPIFACSGRQTLANSESQPAQGKPELPAISGAPSSWAILGGEAFPAMPRGDEEGWRLKCPDTEVKVCLLPPRL